MLTVGIIGSGRMAQVHAHNLQLLPDVELAYIASAKGTGATVLAESVGAKVVDVNQILNIQDLDALIIASATETHAQLAIPALENGLSVFCEKPLDIDLNHAAAVARAAHKSKKNLFVGFNRRFDPQFTALKEAIKAGKVGIVEQLTLISRDPSPPNLRYLANSGGLFRDMMIHDFDMIRFLLESEPNSIQVQGGVLIDHSIGEIGDIDTATALLTTANGQQVQIINSRRTMYGYDQRIEAFGSLGLLQVGNIRENHLIYSSQEGSQQARLDNFFMQRYAKAFEIELHAFIKALQCEEPMPVDGFDGVAALYLAEQAVESLKTGCTVNFDLKSDVTRLLSLE